MTGLLEPQLEYAFELRVEVGPPTHIGRSASEDLNFTPITGGTVEGSLLSGRILPGGGDYWVTRGDTTQLDARYLIEAADGAVIDIVNRGYFRAADEVLRRAEAGEPMTESDIYYRTAPVFQTDAPAHRWLTGNQFIGMARGEPGFVCIRVYVLR
ncbi:DUF3237 domain-containing protein [Subtercola sp. YIM 133946]|uniref:DUF3237 domain-containing protein n=1 Tax=Subtercola sp. YIM 133946 TaxID=3118909 RepID=UPI002F95204D